MSDLQETVRAKADELATRTREVWHDAGLDEKAATVAASLAAAGAAAGAKIKDAGLDEKAAELATRLRDSKTAQQATDVAREYSDRALERVNDWLVESGAGERLGIAPPPKRKSRSKLFWLLALAAAVAGAMVARNRGKESPYGSMDMLEESGPANASTGPSEQRPLADKVRTAIGEDPRTRELPERLNINVVEGTVFVRGPVPGDFNAEDLRTVIANVDGVTDVDLQVTTA